MRSRLLLLGFGFASALSGCGDDGTGPASSGRLRILPATDTVTTTDTVQLSASIDGNLTPVTWKVVPATAGTISANGLLISNETPQKIRVIATTEASPRRADTARIEIVHRPAISKLTLVRDTVMQNHSAIVTAEFVGGTGDVNGMPIESGDSLRYRVQRYHDTLVLKVTGYGGLTRRDTVLLYGYPVPTLTMTADARTAPVGGTTRLTLFYLGDYGSVRLLEHPDTIRDRNTDLTFPVTTVGQRTFTAEYSSPDTSFTRQVTVTGMTPGVGQYDSITMPRAMITPAVAVLADGKVLVAGGLDITNVGTTDAFVIDPVARTVEQVGSLHHVMRGSSIRLNDGRVLVLADRIAEVYDPVSRTFTALPDAVVPRGRPGLALLPNGEVLVFGGDNVRKPELFDPVSLTFRPTDSTIQGFINPALIPLANGKVLVTDGRTSVSSQLYDPGTGRFTLTGAVPQSFFGRPVSRLQDGRVLIAGSENPQIPGAMAIYDPATGVWTLSTPMLTPRYGHTATLLRDGRLLLAGGWGEGFYEAPYDEIYDPANNRSEILSGTLAPSTRIGAKAVALPDGRVLIVGGGTAGDSRALAQIFTY